MMRMFRFCLAFLLAGFAFLGMPDVGHSMDTPTAPKISQQITRVTTPAGIEAWLIQDKSLPIISMAFRFGAGSLQDPADRPGIADFLGQMMMEGAGKRDDVAFAAALEDHSIQLGLDVDTDSFSGSLKTLSVHQDLAFSLLGDALNHPRYDARALNRIRADMLLGLQQSMLHPQWQLAHMQRQAVYGDHPLAGRVLKTLEALPRITAADLESWRKRELTRDRLLVTVVGDISPEVLAQKLDSAFGPLAAKAETTLPAHATLPRQSRTTILARDVPQALLSVTLPGLDRNDPDWFAAMILDRIYGGGGFQSRLMQEIRVARGLTYGIYSRLSPGPFASTINIGTSTRPEAIADIIDIIRDEMLKIRNQGIDAAALADAKSYINGAFALNMTSTGEMAQILLSMRFYHLGIDYLERRADLVNAVTLDDIKRVAERLYRPELMQIVIMGTGMTLPDAQTIMPPAKPEDGRAWVQAIEAKL